MDITQFFKFGVVGATGLVIDFSVTWLFKEKIGLNKYISNSLGFLIAVTNNYFLNKYFTFKNNDENIQYQFICFLIVSIIGFLLNNLLLYLFQNKTKQNFYISKGLATAIVFIWNYLANNYFTFR